MLLKSSDIEKEIHNLKENINNSNKSNIEIIKNKRVWSQKSSRNFRNIIKDINKYLINIRQSKNLLFDQEDLKKKKTKNKKQEKARNNLSIKIEKESKRKTFDINISDNYSRNIKDIQNKIREIRNKVFDAKLRDIKSLKNISSNFYIEHKPLIIIKNNKKELKKRPTSASTYFESKLFQTNINRSSRKKPTKKKNFKYLNINIKENDNKINLARLLNVYRRKMNNSINIYNPKKHLKDMKLLQIEDINMRRNINNINDKIKKTIKNRCGGFYFKHKYEKYIATKNKTEQINEFKLKSSEYIKDKKNNKSISNRNKLALLRKRSFSANNFLSQRINSRNEEKTAEKEKMKQKRENLKNILDMLKLSLDIEPIHAYINDKVKFRNRINKDIKGDKIKYFSQYEEMSKKIEEINEDNKETYESDNNIKNIFLTKEKISKNFYNSRFSNK